MAGTTMNCPKCKGAGLIPHKKRQITYDDGKSWVDDPTDRQTEETCDGKCGGSGKVPFDPATVTE